MTIYSRSYYVLFNFMCPKLHSNSVAKVIQQALTCKKIDFM